MVKGRTQKGSNTGVNISQQSKYPTTKVDLSGVSASSPSGEDLDNKILYQVEENYSKIVEEVIEISKGQLEKEGETKRELRSLFTRFFSAFIFVQFAALLVLIFVKGFNKNFLISETLLTTYIISVFVETLGIIAAMVAFIFNSKEEVSIIDTLNAAIGNYQKFTERNNEKEN